MPTTPLNDARELPWDLRKRGLQDSIRHDQRVKDAIRKNLRELIAEETIITSDGTKRVKIPLRYLEQYRFKYGQPQQGIGQGQGKPGDVIGRTGQANGPGDGQPGEQPGEQGYEAEVPLEDIVEMMLKDLALPWLEEKAKRQVVSESIRFSDRRRRGQMANLAKRPTLIENIKRNATKGEAKVEGLREEDLRFNTWDIHQQRHANAAVYMCMDRSGSMTTSKKYIAKSFFFWMVRFLRLKYEHVETVFIAHDTEALIVPEKDFFSITNSGGTKCSSAYRLTLDTMRVRHPVNLWNIYVFHFSDGDNLPDDNNVCKALVTEMLPQCNMVGYGEIRYKDDASFYGWIGGPGTIAVSPLQLKLNEIQHPRLMTATITNKDEIYKVLQQFLQPKPEPNRV